MEDDGRGPRSSNSFVRDFADAFRGPQRAYRPLARDAPGGSRLAQRDDELSNLEGLLIYVKDAKDLIEKSDGQLKDICFCPPPDGEQIVSTKQMSLLKTQISTARQHITKVHDRVFDRLLEKRGILCRDHLREEGRVGYAGSVAGPRERSRSAQSSRVCLLPGTTMLQVADPGRTTVPAGSSEDAPPTPREGRRAPEGICIELAPGVFGYACNAPGAQAEGTAGESPAVDVEYVD